MTVTELNLDRPEFPVAISMAPETASTTVADETPGNILLINPVLCRAFKGNGRAESPFDPARNRALIESIRVDGQVAPAIVRRVEPDRYEIVAGTRRWHAVRHLRENGAPDTLFKVCVVDLDDETAWRESSAENVGRSAYTPLQLARSWKWAIDNTHNGEQQAFAAARGIDPGVISRTLSLLDIPPVIQAAHTDFERASVHFAEQVVPALRDTDRRRNVVTIAANLASAGVKLAGPRLVERLLLSPAEVEQTRPQSWALGENQRAVTWKKDEKGGATLRLSALGDDVRQRDRTRVLAALTVELRQHLGLTSAPPKASDENSGASE
ncbi:MAG: ParB/RepB/Spo0J family partition protein [Sphingomonas sp.]|uniref:ParB/RepB/Spo0J family partition protein n=1 Tax=Sphingomonas sp. TaxID=28214 RepID=UPI00261F8A83|nr:ParB/RepB/Spo0J family partition protein [Sphingomonas sp.]MDK2767891.1 ParB/RepB/Spo0J family partition protein [Sphingomonas sp.]